jgi:hypothetical protein
LLVVLFTWWCFCFCCVDNNSFCMSLGVHWCSLGVQSYKRTCSKMSLEVAFF